VIFDELVKADAKAKSNSGPGHAKGSEEVNGTANEAI